MKIKIGLFLSSEPYYGGTYQYCRTMVQAVASLPSEDFIVKAYYTKPNWKNILGKYPIKAIQIYEKVKLRRIFQNTNEGLTLRLRRDPFEFSAKNILSKQKCDLWIFPTQRDYSNLVDQPVLAAIHDLMHHYEPSFFQAQGNEVIEWRDNEAKSICKHAKGVLVDSETGRQHVIESYGMDTDKIFTLPYIPPRYIYEHKDEYISDFDLKYDVPEKFIFYPAQLWKHKNHISLIKAVANLREEIKDIKLVFTGHENSAYEELQQLIKQLKLEKEVRFFGYVPDKYLPEFYRRARAMVMPTFFGPTNIPPLEAFAMGCPAAVSDIYGMPEQVGDAALLFNPHSIDEISNCIKRLWTDDDLCRELVKKGYKRSEEWGPKQFSNRLGEIIKNVLKEDTRDKIKRIQKMRCIRNKPLISIVVCSYSNANLLKICLESLVNQTYSNSLFEVIIINNNPSDAAQKVIEEFVQKNSNFRSYKEYNKGLVYSRKRGCSEAQGKYIAFINEDSKVNPDWCERIVSAFMDVVPKPDIVGGPIHALYETEPPAWFLDEYEVLNCGELGGFLKYPEGRYELCGSNMAFPKHILEKYISFSTDSEMLRDKIGFDYESSLFYKIIKDNHSYWYHPMIEMVRWVSVNKFSTRYCLKRAFLSGITDARMWGKESRIKKNCKYLAKFIKTAINYLFVDVPWFSKERKQILLRNILKLARQLGHLLTKPQKGRR